MRCKKHIPDLTSTVGVCASCLRERLEALLAAQAQAQAQPQHSRVVPRPAASSSSDHRKPGPEHNPNPNPPPLNFPRSVSPYVSRRKSDFAGRNGRDRHLDRLFYSTPQVGSAAAGAAACDRGTAKERHGKFWILSNLFRSRSKNPESSSRESCDPPPPSSSAAPASPSWFSTILAARRHRNDAGGGAIEQRNRESDRGTDDLSDQLEGRDRSTSDSGFSSESSPRRQQMTPAVEPPSSSRRSSPLGFAGKSMRTLAFCLSPLVRASPNRHWGHNNKGLGQDFGGPGPHHLSTAASLYTNRSRKLADFGRVGHRR